MDSELIDIYRKSKYKIDFLCSQWNPCAMIVVEIILYKDAYEILERNGFNFVYGCRTYCTTIALTNETLNWFNFTQNELDSFIYRELLDKRTIMNHPNYKSPATLILEEIGIYEEK